MEHNENHMIRVINAGNMVANFEPFEGLINKLVAGIAGTDFDVTTGKGMREAKEVRLQIRTARINLDKAGKTAKRNLNTEKKRIDSEVDRLTALAMTGETPLHELIKAEEDRKAEEKRLRDEAELERKTKIQLVIQGIAGLPAQCHGKSADDLKGAFEYLEAYEITDFFAEFIDQAIAAHNAALDDLRAMFDARVKQDAGDAERAAEDARLMIMKAEQDERQRVLDCQQDEIDRKKAEAEKVAAMETIEEPEDAPVEQPAETTPAVLVPPVQDEEPEWKPLVCRLKKDVLKAILGVAQDECVTIYVALERIESICMANLKATK